MECDSRTRTSAFAPILERVAELDTYYVPTRYPNALPGGVPARVFGRDAAERALAGAQEVMEVVKARWPET